MTDYTLNYSLPFPEGDDQVVVHADVERLAKRTDTAIETAKNDATNTASADATTKANAAKSEAINTAAADATTKANAVLTEAVNTAATDATKKANAARDAAIQDATQKYGGIPQRVTNLETSVTEHGQSIDRLDSEVLKSHGIVEEGTDLDTLRAHGAYVVRAKLPVLNGPPGWEDANYTLEVLQSALEWTLQRATNTEGNVVAARQLTAYSVTDWTFGPDPVLLNEGVDLDDLRLPGQYRVGRLQPVLNAPPFDDSFALEVLTVGGSWTMQRASDGWGVSYERRVGGPGGWSDWVATGVGTAGTGGVAHTAMEVTGNWSTYDEETVYLETLSEHRQVHVFTAGTTVEGREIHAIRLGDPANPTVLLLSGQHGDEPGTREGAMIFAREMAQAETLALMDVCVLIVPTLNSDRLLIRRTNANNVDTNRDWAELSQPETQAMDQLLNDYNVVAAVDAHNGGHRHLVTMREAEVHAKPEILDLSRRLYDNCLDMYAAKGIGAGRYNRSAPVIDDPRLARDRLATHYHAAALTLEVPNHWHYDPPAPYTPQPSWQAHMTALCYHEVVNTVHRNLQDFLDAKHASPAPPETGEAYRWTGPSRDSASAKYVDGELVARNLFRNTSFENGLDGIGSGGGVEISTTVTPTAIAAGSQALSATLNDASQGSSHINQFTVDISDEDAGKWMGYSFVARRSTGTTEAVGAYVSWTGSDEMRYVTWWPLDDAPNSEQPRRVIAVQIPEDATSGRFWVRASGSDTGQTAPSDGTIHTDAWFATIADTQAEAETLAANGFDGDGPWN